eukprot:gnl/MRDRNA2_/MRDRNA2_82284_c0_seq4.p1 gnl/MRDRNA2_/MRDRNA2_82284_c0~~gnl/MRDRNA2_/MRDRNA2_82284_c0_seq4.p1  ORF type:complete len:354 (+),score=90.84 gnl/MRDRNA2_/MRDRNA2_82284_c0_seq4:125-1186(+)
MSGGYGGDFNNGYPGWPPGQPGESPDGSQWPVDPQTVAAMQQQQQLWASQNGMGYPPAAPWPGVPHPQGYYPGASMVPDQYGTGQPAFPPYPPAPPHSTQPATWSNSTGLADHGAPNLTSREGVPNDDDQNQQGEGGSDDEEAGDDEDDDKDSHAMAVYCKECQTWLNGPRQWEDHKIGKKHRKNVVKARRGNAGGAPTDEKEPTPDEAPEKPSAMWDWLEEAKVQKEKEAEEKGDEAKKTEGEGEKTSRSARRRRHKKEKEEQLAREAEGGVNQEEKTKDLPTEALGDQILADVPAKNLDQLESTKLPEKPIPDSDNSIKEPRKVPPREGFKQMKEEVKTEGPVTENPVATT